MSSLRISSTLSGEASGTEPRRAEAHGHEGHLRRYHQNPQEPGKRIAQTHWRALSARDPLERRVARLLLSLAAQQHLITRTTTDKLRSLTGTRTILARYLDRAEPRARFLHDESNTTGQRLLDRLAGIDAGETAASDAG